MQWRHIDTVPKDGTKVLVCQATDADRRPISGEAWGLFVQVAAWWQDEGDGEWVVFCDLTFDPELHFCPTHWMPLPSNPMAEGASDGE